MQLGRSIAQRYKLRGRSPWGGVDASKGRDGERSAGRGSPAGGAIEGELGGVLGGFEELDRK